MEENDFMDLNTTELFDDSNDSFDKNDEGNNSETINSSNDGDNFRITFSPDNEDDSMLVDGAISSDAGKATTEVSLKILIFSDLFAIRHWLEYSDIHSNVQKRDVCSLKTTSTISEGYLHQDSDD